MASVEDRLAGLAERLELTEVRAAALETLCGVLISHLDPLERQRLGQRRTALRRRLDAERPRVGEVFPDERYRVLNLLDELLEEGLSQDAGAPIDTE